MAEKAIAAMTIAELERRLAEEEEKDAAVIDITPDAVDVEAAAESYPPPQPARAPSGPLLRPFAEPAGRTHDTRAFISKGRASSRKE